MFEPQARREPVVVMKKVQSGPQTTEAIFIPGGTVLSAQGVATVRP